MVRQRKSKKNRHNGEAEEDKENETTKVNESLVKFKQEKSKCKTGFTKARHGLLQLLEEDLPSRREVREARSKLNDRLDKVIEALVNLSTYYENRKDIDNVIKVNEEIEQIEREYSAAQNRTQEYFDARKDEASSATSEAFSENTDGAKQHKTYTQKWVEESFRSPTEVEEKRHNQELTKDAKPDNSETSNIPDAKKKETKPADLAHDLWRQLKRVSIPVFTGNKAHYENWKAAFIACIDSAPATAEYKLLQLRQYLAGEALKVIESLGHSATAYEAAKSRLDRKYGGKRRQIALYLEEIENLKPLRQGNPKDIEHFADILDVAIINLKEAGRHEELGNGSLYLKLLKKMTTQMLTQYNRWIFESSKTECVETLREWVLQEAEFQAVASETLRGLLTPKQNTHTFFAKTEQETRDKRKCKLCENGDHPLWRCSKFKGMSVEDRWNNAKHLRVCYRCLRGNHIGSQCTRTRVCGLNGCQESHDRLLHREKPANRYASVRDEQTTSGTEGEPQVPAERTHTTTLTTAEEPKNDARHIALRTVPVVVSNGRREIVINALLDDGSTKTYINSDVAFELGLHGEVRNVTVNVLNGEENVFKSMPVTFNLKSVDGKTSTRMSAFTTDRVTGDLQPIDWRRNASKWKHLTGIHFPRLGRRPVIDMLIGIDHAELHYSLRDVRGKSGQPIARLTPLGWTCIGGHNACGGDTVNFNATFFLSSADQEISSTLQRFWEIETAGTEKQKPNYTLDEISALKQVERSIHFKDGRYEVSMPWQTDKIDLPDNYSMAVKRLENTEKRLLKNKEIGKAYSNTIQDYLKKGYISKVEKAKSYEDEESRQQWFLPHFPLVKPDRTTTKVRLIFDASAKHDGVCLNDVIHKGPKLQRELFDVLLRFRRYPYALVGDIAEMYLRIGISPECRPFHRFLWRDLDTSKTPQVYQFNSLVFGVNSCPFQAQFVSRYHAEKNKDSFPKAANTILESTYMDDSMDSAPTESECIEVYQQLSKLWGSAGMYARKWLSNSAHVLLEVPEEDRATHVNLDEGHLPSIKTLGVMWIAKEDVFTFTANTQDNNKPLSKRNFLAETAALFDPMGFLAPFIIRAKIILQDLWTSGIDWDDKLDDEHAKRAMNWFNELQQLSEIKIPRCIQLNLEVKTTTLHTFVDASGEAYGAVVYCRCEYVNGVVSVRLVASKTRVAPLSAQSIPRLELMAAVLGLRLGRSVAETLKMDKDTLRYWTDSMNVLWWIRGRSRNFKPFVANRVSEIQDSSRPSQWHHVPTSENPADLPSRGTSVENLRSCTLWWEGPDFLKRELTAWPETKIGPCPDAMQETKKGVSSTHSHGGSTSEHVFLSVIQDDNWRLRPERFSSWRRLTRVRAWASRFVNNCRKEDNLRQHGELTVQEITNAELEIIREAQRASFRDEYKALMSNKSVNAASKIVSLKPILDEDGVMRSDGRLVNADYLPYDVKFPIILPRRNWVTKLIVKTHHEKGGHQAGTNQTLASISSRFWVQQGREEIREWENECRQCRRRKALSANQLMAPLPRIRVKLPLRAFARVAVDYAGPFITIQGRGQRRAKRYLCLFTCLLSRAVHLEMSYSMDTDSFLNAFFRMVNRRGRPVEVLSDNGSNFIGGERDQRQLVELLDKEKVRGSAANKGIHWHFNPASAPHFGGVHETLIKAAKRATYAILSNADITDEELVSAFTGAESLINSRPLTYQSAHPADDVPLTPNHFLFGQVGGEFAPESVDETQFNLKKRWRRVQELVRHFWNRWLREWLPALQKRSKWNQEKVDIKTGDVVLVLKPDSPRAQWPLGRILEVFPGIDGHVRSVKVKVGDKTFSRPITKICPLELHSETA